MYDFQFEKFRDIYEFDKAINERSNNEVMKNCHSSQNHSSWGGVSTYEESEELLRKGWNAKVEEMKVELRKYSNTIERIRVRNRPSMAGHAPIVPAAIKGVPKSMWMQERQKVNEKKRTLHIYFNNTGNASEEAEDIMKSGMAILKLCILLEKMGIKVKIDILPFVSKKGSSVYGCGIGIKDYQQPFNLQKMAYPIAHTSIFRRQGLKWLETMKNCTNSNYACGYGSALYDDGEIEAEFKKKFKLDEAGSVYINYYDCRKNDFNAEKIAKSIGLNLEIEGGRK